MAGLDRETLFSTLATRLTGSFAGGCQRRFRDISQVRAEEQPIAFLVQGEELPKHAQAPGQGTIWLLDATLWIYARTDDPSAAPSSVLNPLLTAVEGVLQASSAAAGGYASAGVPARLGAVAPLVRILRTERGEGVNDGQAVAIVHLQIEAQTP